MEAKQYIPEQDPNEGKVGSITEYQTVRASCVTSLDDRVNKLITEGWRPLGGPCCDRNDNAFQAMVRK